MAPAFRTVVVRNVKRVRIPTLGALLLDVTDSQDNFFISYRDPVAFFWWHGSHFSPHGAANFSNGIPLPRFNTCSLIMVMSLFTMMSIAMAVSLLQQSFQSM